MPSLSGGEDEDLLIAHARSQFAMSLFGKANGPETYEHRLAMANARHTAVQPIDTVCRPHTTRLAAPAAAYAPVMPGC